MNSLPNAVSQIVDEEQLPSGTLAAAIREVDVLPGQLALWFLGQNGFIVKSPAGTTVAIDPYLTNSCEAKISTGTLNLARCLPVPIQPQALYVDYYLVTHSHEDHLDEQTVRSLRCKPVFLAPWQAYRRLLSFGIPPERCILLHPADHHALADLSLDVTFALPTDSTDLNHVGLLLTSGSGVSFYNTGDTAYAEGLPPLLPHDVDVCAICINGKFNNLGASQAASVVSIIRPRVVIPTHYDMMVCNLADPNEFNNILRQSSLPARLHIMRCGELYLVNKAV